MKKTIRVLSGSNAKSSLSEAIKHTCGRETKFAIVDWIQRTYNKKTSDEVSKEIGLAEAKQVRRRVKHVERSERKAAVDEEARAAPKKVKTDQTEDQAKTRSPMRSPMKQPSHHAPTKIEN